jgi:hypothetical protein
MDTYGFDVSFTRLEHFCDILRQKSGLRFVLYRGLPATCHVETSRSRNCNA